MLRRMSAKAPKCSIELEEKTPSNESSGKSSSSAFMFLTSRRFGSQAPSQNRPGSVSMSALESVSDQESSASYRSVATTRPTCRVSQ